MQRPLIVALVILALPAASLACIWDSDTLEDELKQSASTFDVITGQFARHGDAYYRARLERTKAELAGAPDSIETLYDIGAAYLRLGEHGSALEAFQRVEQIAPDRYKTHSNLGVLYGEMGEYTLAVKHMEQAIAKHPDAHFGAAWLHLAMLRWKAIAESGRPQQSFVGAGYSERWKMGIQRAAAERAKAMGLELEKDYDGIKVLTTLLRANPDFADGYLVLAANLHGDWNLNLALWAYLKARTLGHPRTDVIDAAIEEIFEHWRDTIKHGQHRDGQHLEPKSEALQKITTQLQVAKAWIGKFQAREAKWISDTGQLPGFDDIRTALEKEGVHRCEPTQVGLIGATGGGGSPADGEWQDAHGPAQGGKRAKQRGLSPANAKSPAKSDAQGGAGAPGMIAVAPRADGPPVGGSRADEPDSPSPPVMRSPDRQVLETKSKEPEMRGGADIGPRTKPETVEPRTSETGGTPWFVWFGFAMLAVSVGAVVIARARQAS